MEAPAFVYNVNPARIVFGAGTLASLAREVSAAGCRRVLILSTPFQKPDAERLASDLGELTAGVFSEAAMHTPTPVTNAAVAKYSSCQADGVVSLGGGSTIGLGKAIAYRTDAIQFAVPTTYAGSEVTPILGQTEQGKKTTLRSNIVLPEVVIYDPDLTLGLPVAMSVTSGLNAMAHAIEAIYAQDRNPISSLMAVEGVRSLRDALPQIVRVPYDRTARGLALYGSWLCGTVLGTVGMSLHHKLCHTLGGSFDLPHSETHAILIPHTAAYNELAASDQLAPIANLFGGRLGAGLWEFAKSIGSPVSLKELGLEEADIERAADVAVQNPYWNPREIDRNSIAGLLRRAWAGQAPQS
ncbi:maleylacetate reductase [Nitratireductor luteus]|uniref:maleylacetate reductase n=1 Tax=Nitratireductor luteus TaxID=2976980 RepID=UPI00223E8EE6